MPQGRGALARGASFSSSGTITSNYEQKLTLEGWKAKEGARMHERGDFGRNSPKACEYDSVDTGSYPARCGEDWPIEEKSPVGKAANEGGGRRGPTAQTPTRSPQIARKQYRPKKITRGPLLWR